MSIISIPTRIRSLKRLPQIVRVALKYGFGDVVARAGLDTVLHRVKSILIADADPLVADLSTEERIRMMLEELGPTFVKLGQVMATRPDLIPLSLATELRKLQDKVKPFDTKGIATLVAEELGQPVADVFSKFNDQPLAAASIAQVHRATLKDGREVVLKIQRPNLKRVIETDLAILNWLASAAEENIPELRRYSPLGLVSEFEKSLTKEIDFETEAYHMRRFAKNFADDPDVYVPEVYGEWSTSRILCEEFIDGTPLNDPSIRDWPADDRRKLAQVGIRVILEQALVHGFFHGDPHPGNIFVLPDKRLVMIDYGMMGILDQERIDDILTFLVAVLTRDLDKLIRLFYKLELIGENADIRSLRRGIDDLISRFESVELAQINIGRYLTQVFEVVIRHDVQIPSDLLMVGKALATIEGVGRDLYPELNTLEEIRPIILKIYLGRLTDPGYYARTPRRITEDLLYLLETGPRDLRLSLRKLREGELKTKLELVGLEKAQRGQAQAMNRLSLALVNTALIMGSTYLFAHATQPELVAYVGEFPLNGLLGLFGFGLAVVYGAVLTIGFLRSGAF
ncbi:MAG: AarF/ABC1/UbiB kinase family protein [Planctomycetes bacterium]|nr:AarF/ABC1/UbiB kinase family protein [Planctomycetota bacterium]